MAGLKKPRSEKIAFARVLQAIHEEAGKIDGQITQQQIAKQMTVASSAVSSWFRGLQVPRDKYLTGLAELFAPRDQYRQEQYRSKLYAAAGRNEYAAAELSKRVDLFEEFRSGRRKLRIGLVEYSAIGKFFKTILSAFAKFDGIDLDVEGDERFHDLTQGIAAKRFGLGAPILASPDRALQLDFIETPILMSVNAFTYSGALSRMTDLSFDPAARAIKPIVNKDEVGGRFAIHALGFEDGWARSDCPDYKPASYAKTLLENWTRWQAQTEEQRSAQPIPVIFADELTCLNVQREWLKEEFAGRHAKDSAKPVLLLGEGRTGVPKIIGPDVFRVVQPSKFRVCICIDRAADNWPRYFAEAWRIFLHNNSEFIAEQYAQLYVELFHSLEPFKLSLSGPDLYDFWDQRIRGWLRFPERKQPVSKIAETMLFSDEAIWSKIVATADGMTREKPNMPLAQRG
jgi:transcriptional regulator with XRE-family HTH domain